MNQKETYEEQMARFASLLDKLTPEQRAERDRVLAERDADLERFKHRSAVAALRDGWGASVRHGPVKVDPQSGFGRAFAKLAEQIGQGFTIGLCGRHGTGKTQMGMELMRAATEKLRSAKYVTAADIFRQVKATFAKSSEESEIDVLKRYQSPKLLVIDEVGKLGDTEWEGRLLFSLVDKRYADKKDTLLLSNYDRAQFANALGSSIVSRMNETGGMIECNWESFRQ